ncbi:hypothetical protein Desaci_0446 [Desulfosporosinus acidiphilus SJ4]|uniref:Uncharacterized protein n=1 Tax=Desulfosporosinus acidiphilus (strain DSM 22704 / JCM 16185 / SJ4) TaxID=646529 RepID=I4D139_DESAJ|nr:hypothetical protein Desaci_0446 [Desulfosporosinus acidiphilus SJ4]
MCQMLKMKFSLPADFSTPSESHLVKAEPWVYMGELDEDTNYWQITWKISSLVIIYD